jgi:hypothetical protein
MENNLAALLTLFVSISSALNSNVVQIPFHTRSINLPIEEWKGIIGGVQKLMIDQRIAKDKELVIKQQSGQTLQINEIITIKPQLQSEQLTEHTYKASIHTTDTLMILLAGTSLEDEKVIRDMKLEGKYITCLQYHKNHPFTEIKTSTKYDGDFRDYVLLEYY